MRKRAYVLLSGLPADGQLRARSGEWRAEFFAGLAAVAFIALTVAVAPPPVSLSGLTSQQASDAYAKLPLSFIPNRGQTNESVRYYAQGSGYAFYFTDDKAVLSFERGNRGQALQMRFLGASPEATVAPARKTGGKVSYLKGDDPQRWQAGLSTYGQLAYQGLWSGVDMRFQGAGGKLKYEFSVKPGAGAERIRLAYAGAEGLSLSSNGSLLIHTQLGTLRDSRPRAWQWIGGRRVPVQSRYSLDKGAGGTHAYGFALGAYDHSRPLVIDPGLAYSTYLGGTGTDLGNGIAVDGAGRAYVTGRTTSLVFPTTAGAFDTTPNGGEDAFVTKLSPNGSSLAYSTFLGGTGVEEAHGIAVDATGSAYITGETTSSDFPATAGAFDPTSNGDDAFVTKLDPAGSSLSYSTFLGGTSADYGHGIALDAVDNAYVTGYTLSGNFPTTVGAFDTTNAGFFDVFVTKLDAAGSALAYSTFLGGGETDTANGIAVDGAGSAHVAGGTRSAGFPTTSGAFDTSANGTDDGFVTKLNASGSGLAYSTFLGGTNTDGAGAIALDAAGSAYLTGYTASSNFPTTTGAFDTSYNDDGDAFVTKLNAAGSALGYSTYLGGTGAGGTGYDSGGGIAVDGSGGAYITGRTDSLLFPTTAGAFDTIYNGVGDTFLTKLDTSGSVLAYSTYLGGTGTDVGGGIAVDDARSAYVAGYSTSSDFPTSAGAFDTTSNGGYDAFVAKFDLIPPGYPRPAGASPHQVSLAIAFKECVSPNFEHGPPLASPSCNPPAQESSQLTVGTPDANGKVANSVGSVRYAVSPGDPSTPANEADVKLVVSMTDVRTQGTLGDYTGELSVEQVVQITDRFNGPSQTETATVQETPFRFAVPCAATGSSATGGNCSLSSSFNAVVPGSVLESNRAIWELGGIDVYDGGPDGQAATADNTLFARQGLFVP